VPLPPLPPAVVRHRRHPHQGGDALAGERPQLGQVGDQHPPDRAGGDGRGQFVVRSGDPLVQSGDVCADALGHRRRRRVQAVHFHRPHVGQLPPAGDDRLQPLGVDVGQRAEGWGQAFAIVAGSLLIATLAGLLPALRAVKTRIPDTLAYE
jgi:hypothetical protein